MKKYQKKILGNVLVCVMFAYWIYKDYSEGSYTIVVFGGFALGYTLYLIAQNIKHRNDEGMK